MSSDDGVVTFTTWYNTFSSDCNVVMFGSVEVSVEDDCGRYNEELVTREWQVIQNSVVWLVELLVNSEQD